MRKIIEYIKLVIFYNKRSTIYYLVFYMLAITLCLFVISEQEKLRFWDLWMGYDNNFPFTIMSLKLLILSFIFLLVDILDIRNHNISFYYYILSRHSFRKKLDNKIDCLLLLILSVIFLLCYSLIISYLSIYNVTLPIVLFRYVIIEFMSIVSAMFLYKNMKITSGSVIVIFISLMNMSLPIKLPILATLVSVDKIYDIWIYLVVLIIVSYYKIGGKKYDTNRKSI